MLSFKLLLYFAVSVSAAVSNSTFTTTNGPGSLTSTSNGGQSNIGQSNIGQSSTVVSSRTATTVPPSTGATLTNNPTSVSSNGVGSVSRDGGQSTGAGVGVIPNISIKTPSPAASFTGTLTIGLVPQESSPPQDPGGTYYPAVNITAQEGTDTIGFQLDTYVNAVSEIVGFPPPVDGNEQSRIIVPACPNMLTTGKKRNLPRAASSLANFKCSPDSITVDVYFHYVSNGVLTTLPDGVALRVQKQMAFMKAIFDPYKIYFRYSGTLDVLISSDFTNHQYISSDLPYARQQITRDNQKFQSGSRVGGPEVLNIWIVNSVSPAPVSATNKANGYAYYPSWKGFAHDGIILAYNSLTASSDSDAAANPSIRGGILVHEFGHWMGLQHVFGETTCGTGDEITDTSTYSNLDPGLHSCSQAKCGTGAMQRVQNWMSYSSCRGTNPDNSVNYNGFSIGQKASMFAEFLTFRALLPCSGGSTKRSLASLFSSLILRRGLHSRADIDQATLLANLLLVNCSVAIQDVYRPDTLPLAHILLSSYSSAASSMQATPAPMPTGSVDPDAQARTMPLVRATTVYPDDFAGATTAPATTSSKAAAAVGPRADFGGSSSGVAILLAVLGVIGL